MEDTSDHELMRRMTSGDADAFTRLYRRHQAAVYRFAFQMSGSAALADDVVQEVFLTLMREACAYDAGRGALGAFLYGIARNHVRRKMERPWLAREEETGETAAEGHPESELARSETIRAVRAAVLALPEHYREAVVLCDLEEAGYEEAALALGCSVGTVRSRLHRGRRLLARRLGAFDNGRMRRDIRPAGCSI